MSAVEVWWAPLALCDRRLRALLAPADLQRIDALDAPADQARSLLAAAVVRVLAGHHLGRAPAAVPVDRDCPDCAAPHGRPRILGTHLQLSVSHSGQLVAVATASGPVGIDVQVRSGAQEVRDWVQGEALLKSGLRADRARLIELTPPLAGYDGALAVARTDEPPDVLEHHAGDLLQAATTQ